MLMRARNRPYPVGTTRRSTVGVSADGPVLHARTGLASAPSRPTNDGRLALCGATVYPTDRGDDWTFDPDAGRVCPRCATAIREARS